MKRIFLLLVLISAAGFAFAQNNEFELKVTFKPFKRQFIYLGYHYGKQKPIIDSVMLDDNSVGIFKRAKKLEKGVYLIGFPNKAGYFEVLIDKEQKFSVIADSADLIPSMKFVGSNDNTLFLQYQNYASTKGREIESLKESLRQKSKKNKTTILLKKQGGVFTLPCKINGLNLEFIFDTGASDVSISLTEALFMLKNNYLSPKDIIGKETFSDATGNISVGTKIIIKKIEFDGVTIYDVPATVVQELEAPLLLGQSAMSKFGAFQLDPNSGELTILSNKNSSLISISDSLEIINKIIKADKEIQQYRQDLIAKNPDATIGALLKAMKNPEVPPAAQHPGGKYDSTFAYRYYKDHYWDDTWFFDERLVRTSFFEEKLDEYFATLIYPNPDSVIKELDWMLAYATANDEMQRFLLVKFINRYLNPQYMWEDKVYVHLFEKYFSQKEYPWLNEKGKKTIFDRYYSMAANLFGAKASDIELPDLTGKTKTLYSVSNPYTVVVFWDPTCGHCKETLPRIDSIFKAKWSSLNVKIYALAKETDGTQKDWIQFITDHKLQSWDHVYYSKEANDARVKNNIPSYYQLYDVQVVPTLYLLDKDKSILAKKIPFDQIDKVLDFKLKGQ